MKHISILSFAILTNICSLEAQVIDDFGDGNFTSSPNWNGNVEQFIVNASHQLQLDAAVAGTSFLATPFAPKGDDLEWRVYVKQSFAGSGNNYGRIYLTSSQFDLTQPTEGYYLQLGEAGSNDAVELFRQSGSTSVSVCRAANATIASSFAIRIKVTRDPEGLWKLLIDYTGGTALVEVASGTDTTHEMGPWMGFVCVYTVGNITRFYFDDVYADGPKTDPPPPDPPLYHDIVINEFFADPSPSVGLPLQEFVEVYNRSERTFDLLGWKLGDATSMATMPSMTIAPGEYVIITNASGLAEYFPFGKVISMSGFPSLNNGGDIIRLTDPTEMLIDSLTYALDWYHDDKLSDGGYTIERLDPEKQSTDINNWFVARNEIGGTPGSRNSVFGKSPDSKPPLAVSLLVLNDSVIAIHFSELMDVASLNNHTNYVMSGLEPDPAWNAADSTVALKIRGMKNGYEYKIVISNLSDLAGNVMVPTEFVFTLFVAHPTFLRDVVITEIMADPSPALQLPDAEFVEIFNRSEYPIQLGGWHLSDASTSATMPPAILLPKQYLIITSTTNAIKFLNLGRVIGVTSFPSLGNSGDQLVLSDTQKTTIDSVAYSIAWHEDEEKAEGGWSLEVIDVSNPCGEENNWDASEDLSGGTPGQPNSVLASKPDVTAPVVLSVFLVSKDTLQINFNERLGDASLKLSLKISPGDHPGIVKYSDLGKRSLIYVMTDSLSGSTPWLLSMNGVPDCNGNISNEYSTIFYVPEEALNNDILINEVLFNPRPNGADFVEVYNRSDKYINLKNWAIHGEGATDPVKIISTTNNMLAPKSYRVLTASIKSTEMNYPSSLGKSMTEILMPSLPDDEGGVTLLDQSGNTIDHFSYSDQMHSPILRDTEGVSLERISVTALSIDPNNWHSANGAVGYATPGDVNSNSRPQVTPEVGTVVVLPEVIGPSASLPFAQINYNFDATGLIANVKVIDLEGRLVKTLAINETLGYAGSFRWDGDRMGGGLAGLGYYMIWFEAFDLDGQVTTYRNRVIVGF